MAEDKSGTLTGQRLGTYQLIEKLGQGGMGAVYKARDVSLQRTVAVKVLPAALAADKTYVKRFVREARALAKLSHPNLVHTYHVGQRDGLYYFAMEYVRGKTLFELIRSSGALTVGEFLRIGGGVLAALQKVHSVGLTHRDVKSSNVVIEDDTSRAVLMDFGLAKERSGDESEPALTSAGMVLGTPEYMSPEQCEGREVDARSDIYSFGIMAYEMLAGAMPFTGKSAIAVLRKQVDEPPPSLSDKRGQLPPELERVVFRALAKVPDERYGSAAEMATDLVRVGQTPELAELAASALPATARTIINAPISSRPSPIAPTVPTMKHASVRGRSGGHKLAAVLGGAAILGVLLALFLMAGGRGCRGRRVVPPPEPGMVGQLVAREGGGRVRVRILSIEGVFAEVQELDSAGTSLGGPTGIDMRLYRWIQADAQNQKKPK
jgi:serine/threonine protein kinase